MYVEESSLRKTTRSERILAFLIGFSLLSYYVEAGLGTFTQNPLFIRTFRIVPGAIVFSLADVYADDFENTRNSTVVTWVAAAIVAFLMIGMGPLLEGVFAPGEVVLIQIALSLIAVFCIWRKEGQLLWPYKLWAIMGGGMLLLYFLISIFPVNCTC